MASTHVEEILSSMEQKHEPSKQHQQKQKDGCCKGTCRCCSKQCLEMIWAAILEAFADRLIKNYLRFCAVTISTLLTSSGIITTTLFATSHDQNINNTTSNNDTSIGEATTVSTTNWRVTTSNDSFITTTISEHEEEKTLLDIVRPVLLVASWAGLAGTIGALVIILGVLCYLHATRKWLFSNRPRKPAKKEGDLEDDDDDLETIPLRGGTVADEIQRHHADSSRTKQDHKAKHKKPKRKKEGEQIVAEVTKTAEV